jgi:hypothetical protein
MIVFLFCYQIGLSQNQKGITFQAAARTSYGVIMPNKQIQVRISILEDTISEELLYQEIKSVITNPLGLFTILIGAAEPAKVITIGTFEKINWTAATYFIRVEIDPENHLQFIRIGQQQIQYAAYAFSADHVLAENVEGVLSIPQGGTGVNNIPALKLTLQIDKVNNIPDSLKILSKASIQALALKFDKKDNIPDSLKILSKASIQALALKLDKADNVPDSLKILSKASIQALALKFDKKDNVPDSLKILSKASIQALALKLDKADNVPDSLKILSKASIQALALKFDKKDNVPDSLKILSKASIQALALKLDKADNVPDSLKILSKASIQALALKLDKKDTASLSNRINQKLNKGEITASELALSLGFLPFETHFGAFTDTARQTALINTATAVKWRDTLAQNEVSIGLNSSLDPTRLLVVKAGAYLVQYSLQVSNTQIANDEISIWFRRNGAAYPNTLRQFLTGAVGVKNIFSGQAIILFGTDDYLELFFSVKHNQTQLLKTSALTNPSRPATPSAQVTLFRIQ